MDGMRASSFDFGNTLVPFSAGPMATVVRQTAEHTASLVGCTVDDFTSIWGEERERQFAEDVPEGREADMDIRVVRVLARVGGRPQPPAGSGWDSCRLAKVPESGEVQGGLET